MYQEAMEIGLKEPIQKAHLELLALQIMKQYVMLGILREGFFLMYISVQIKRKLVDQSGYQGTDSSYRSQEWITQLHVSKQFLPCGLLICVSVSITNAPSALLEILEGFAPPRLCQCQHTSGSHTCRECSHAAPVPPFITFIYSKSGALNRKTKR